MNTYRFCIILSFLLATPHSAPMTTKCYWERKLYTTETVILSTNTISSLETISPKTFNLPYDDLLFNKGDFTLKVALEANRNFVVTSDPHPIFSFFCCIKPPKQEPILQEIETIDNLIETRSFPERRFSSRMRSASQALSPLFKYLHDFIFEDEMYHTSSKNRPACAILVAPSISVKNHDNNRALVIFSYLPFKPLCVLAENFPEDAKIFVSITGDAIAFYNIHKQELTLFKLMPSKIMRDHLHDISFSFI